MGWANIEYSLIVKGGHGPTNTQYLTVIGMPLIITVIQLLCVCVYECVFMCFECKKLKRKKFESELSDAPEQCYKNRNYVFFFFILVLFFINTCNNKLGHIYIVNH